MTAKTYPFALLAKLVPVPAATAKVENPPFVPHWQVSLTNGISLVANTTRPLQDGAAALVAKGIVANPATERVVLWLEEENREAFSSCTVQEAIGT